MVVGRLMDKFFGGAGSLLAYIFDSEFDCGVVLTGMLPGPAQKLHRLLT